MLKRKITVIALMVFFLSIIPSVISIGWWNTSWYFRIPVNVSSGSDQENASVNLEDINFTSLLENLGDSGTFDGNSIRVIEDSISLKYDFDNITYDAGNVTWIAEGSLNTTNRTFYIYFDTIENEVKGEGQTMSIFPYWRSGYEDNMNVWSNQSTSPGIGYEWNKSWAEGVEVTWRWSTESGYDYAYLYFDGVEYGSKEGNSSEVKTYATNSVSARFTSDSGTIESSTDSYGTYGTGVNRIKFYPVSNWVEPSLTVSQETSEVLPLLVSVEKDKSSYGWGENILVSGYVNDTSGDSVNNASVDIKIYYPNSSVAWSNSTSTNSSGYYNYTILCDWIVDGTYSINVTSYKSSYGNATNSTTFSYVSNEIPVLGNQTVTSSAGWGENFNYSIDITDAEGDEVNVALLVYTDNGRWVRNETKSINPPGTLNWTTNPFSCSDVGETRQYKFEYKDQYHSWANTSVFSGPTVEKDDIIIEYLSGNNTSVNRSGEEKVSLSVRLRDTDRNVYIDSQNVNFWVYYSDSWNNVSSNNTEDGNVTLNYNPNCSISVGENNWKANYTGNCYKNKESSTYSFTVIGTLTGNILEPSNSTYSQGDTLPISFNLTDECSNPVLGATLNFSVNGTECAATTEEGNGIYNSSWSSTAKSVGDYTIQVNLTKMNYLSNSTNWYSKFYLSEGPPIITISLTNDKTEQNSSIRINASISEQSGTGLNWVKINVTRPDGTIDEDYMFNTSTTDWYANYNNTWGNTLERGRYNFTIFAQDNTGVSGNSSSSFKVYTRLNTSLNTRDSSYSQGEYGSIYYKVTDINGTTLENISVDLSIENPNRTELYILSGETYTSNSKGYIGTPTFILPADAQTGYHNLTTFSIYYDPLGDYTVTNTNNYTFMVNSKAGFHSKLEIPSIQYKDRELSISVLTFESTNELINPDNITVIVYYVTEQFGLTEWFNISLSDMTKSTTGFYTYSENISSSVNSGNYIALLNTTKDGISTNDIQAFEILTGGPFDVSVEILETEVEQGDSVPFQINVSNTGDTDRFDVNLTYWIGNGKRYSQETSMRVYAHQSTLVPVSFNLDSNEPTGVKTLNVKVTYDPLIKPATASGTFIVKEKEVVTEEPSEGVGIPSGAAVGGVSLPLAKEPEISIIDYPDEVLVERGEIKYITLKVNNTGTQIVHNVSLELEGKISNWMKLKTSESPLLAPGDVKDFIIKIIAPLNETPDYYPFKVKVISSEVEDERVITLRLFSSKEQLYLYQTQLQKNKLSDLKDELDYLRTKGAEVDNIEDNLNIIELKIGRLEVYLEDEYYDQVSLEINEIQILLNKAERQLNEITIPEKSKIPVEKTLLYFLLLLISVVLFLICKKAKRSYKRILTEEKKILRTLYIIEDQYKKGILKKENYEKLKNINEEKFSELRRNTNPLFRLVSKLEILSNKFIKQKTNN